MFKIHKNGICNFLIRSWLLFANFLKMVFRMKLLILVHCAFPVIMLLGWNRFRYVPVRISSMTVGSRSTKTARGTCLPELFFRSRFYRVEFFRIRTKNQIWGLSLDRLRSYGLFIILCVPCNVLLWCTLVRAAKHCRVIGQKNRTTKIF